MKEKILIRMICNYSELKKGEVYTGEYCGCMCGGVLIRATGDVLPDDTYCEILPDWSDYPGWARWRAVDADGGLCCYADEPEIEDDYWVETEHEDMRWKLIGKSNPPPCPNWKDTLEERPEVDLYHLTLPDGTKATCKDYLTPALKRIDDSLLEQYRMPSLMDFMFGGAQKQKGEAGPYEHSFKLPEVDLTAIINGEEIDIKTMELTWSTGTPKEENEMNCPRSKELTAAEMVTEKIRGISEDKVRYVEEADKRIHKLDDLYAAIKDHDGVLYENQIVTALLREADGV